MQPPSYPRPGAGANVTRSLAPERHACTPQEDEGYLSLSEWRVNHAYGRTIRVSSLLAEAVAVALAAADATDGDVDPTCGRSLARLGYDRDFAQARQNASPLSQPAVPAVGWQAVELDRERREITIPGEVTLD